MLIMMIFFFLARDRETGMIVDDAFLAGKAYVQGSDGEWGPEYARSREERNQNNERRIREFCERWEFDLIDYDAFPEFLWRWRFRKCKWAHQRPASVSADEWESRLKSTGELEAYKAGMKARCPG
jgi:hypothetical protein